MAEACVVVMREHHLLLTSRLRFRRPVRASLRLPPRAVETPAPRIGSVLHEARPAKITPQPFRDIMVKGYGSAASTLATTGWGRMEAQAPFRKETGLRVGKGRAVSSRLSDATAGRLLTITDRGLHNEVTAAVFLSPCPVREVGARSVTVFRNAQ